MADKKSNLKTNGIFSKAGPFYDYSLLAVVIILTCFGLVMLYSASSYEATSSFGDDMYYLKKQAAFSVAGVVLAVIVSKFDYHIYLKFSAFLYIISLLLMFMVKFTPLGVTVNGARRWLKIGVQFQPSEIAKIAVILFMVYMVKRLGRDFKSVYGMAVLSCIGALSAIFAYVFTENLSTAVIIMGICVGIIFVAHPKTALFVVLFLALVIVAAGIILYLLYSYDNSDSFRIARILTWVDPEKYSELGGWQVLQGLYAIGSGGFFGKGLGNSTQKLDIIPEAQNDMIFSIICEELGLFGAIIILLLFAYLLYRLMVIAQNAPDRQGTLIAAGIFIHISLQVILNVCVVLNVIPTTGITLPWVSYGGTSVVFLMVEIGVALSISSKIEINDKKEVAGSLKKEKRTSNLRPVRAKRQTAGK